MPAVLAAKREGFHCGGVECVQVCTDQLSAGVPDSVCAVVLPQVEAALGVEGDDILYVGDHIYTDAALAKINFR
jgi:hypothetical protein